MARKPRMAGPNLYHHLYAWGNDRHPVFRTASNRRIYLTLLELYAKRYKIDILAYALMDWHVHLFVFDHSGDLSLFMKSLHGRYAQYFNSATGRVGHVFGERFNSKIVQFNDYGVWLSRYIHRQPIEAGITCDPETFPWTSYRAYLGLEKRKLLKTDIILDQFGRGDATYRVYREFVIGTDEGPITWEKRSPSIVGDNTFVELLKHETIDENDHKQQMQNMDELFKSVIGKTGYTLELLLDPHGSYYRELRHYVFTILVNDYHLTLRQVARLFHVSPTTVMMAQKKENCKSMK